LHVGLPPVSKCEQAFKGVKGYNNHTYMLYGLVPKVCYSPSILYRSGIYAVKHSVIACLSYFLEQSEWIKNNQGQIPNSSYGKRMSSPVFSYEQIWINLVY